jgi:hypothetical protein
LKECIEKGVSYTEYVAEKVDQTIQYSEYVAESANKGIEYSEYVAEKANEISEKLNDTISYADYLGESLNKGIAYSEYIGEQTQQLSDYTEFMLNENGGQKVNGQKVNESTETSTTKVNYQNLDDKIDTILESIKKQKVDEANAIFEANKKNATQALKSNTQIGNELVTGLLNEKAETSSTEEKWLVEAPEEFKALWESLDTKVKNTITAQSKFYKLETSYQIKNFWETRKLNKGEAINESKETEKPTTLGYTPSYLDSIKSGLDRFGRK